MKDDAGISIVYLIDDELDVRESMITLIQSKGLYVKAFDSAQAFLNSYMPDIPGCLVLDLKMPLMNGLELQEELVARDNNIPIIFISGNATVPDTVKAFRSGAFDFLVKPFSGKMLFERIEKAIKSDIDARNNITKQCKVQLSFNALTDREKQVLELIISNHSNKEAAKRLNISHRTVEIHRARIMEKMQAESLVELVAMAINSKLTEKQL